MALISRSLALSALVCASLAATGAHAERHYDCTKAGNANKAVCKNAAAAPAAVAPAVAPFAPAAAATTTSTRHYDCSKAGNANKAVCKGTVPVASATTSTAVAAPAKPSIFSRMLKPKAQPAAPANSQSPAAPAPTTTASNASVGSYAGKSITTNAAGATGQCKDGTFTHATHHSGACSSHGGVAKWM